MTTGVDWPEYCPRPELTFTISGGTLSMSTPSNLLNYGDFVWGQENQISASLWKNGTKMGDITVNTSTGALSMSSVSVTTGDHIEARFIAEGYADTPWKTTVTLRRSDYFDVPSGTSTITFDATTNPMPVPEWAWAFGWDANNHLKTGFAVSADDGASQDMTVTTRRGPSVSESSTTIDLDSASTQTHTSSFVKSDVTGSCEIETLFKSGTGTTRVEDHCRLTFTDKDAVPTYPTGFPTTGTQLKHNKNASRASLEQP
jgi:hypothetical protein